MIDSSSGRPARGTSNRGGGAIPFRGREGKGSPISGQRGWMWMWAIRSIWRGNNMKRALLIAALALAVTAQNTAAFDAVGTIKKVDAEKGVLYIHANGQDRTVKIDKDVKVLGADGKPLADGLKAKELKDGAE